MTINFSGRHFPSDIILYVDHSILNRWIIKYAPLLERRARKIKKPVASSWHMDETYINVKGKWKGGVANNQIRQIYPVMGLMITDKQPQH
ncbi:hypothetical protein BCU63_29885 [Vibrio splendidus]|nr:hypothetical protein BCU63_29885 [Vibrio splendidus]